MFAVGPTATVTRASDLRRKPEVGSALESLPLHRATARSRGKGEALLARLSTREDGGADVGDRHCIGIMDPPPSKPTGPRRSHFRIPSIWFVKHLVITHRGAIFGREGGKAPGSPDLGGANSTCYRVASWHWLSRTCRGGMFAWVVWGGEGWGGEGRRRSKLVGGAVQLWDLISAMRALPLGCRSCLANGRRVGRRKRLHGGFALPSYLAVSDGLLLGRTGRGVM